MLRALLPCLAVLSLASPLRAQAPQEAQDGQAPYGGAQLRLTAGPAYLAAFQDLGAGQDGSIRGFGAGFDFALGLLAYDDLAFDVDLALMRSGDAQHGVLSSTVFTVLHLGVGLTYWLRALDAFVAASVGLARSSVEGDRLRLGIELPDNAPSDLGAGVNLVLGKQLALSQRVGLGACLSLLTSFANNPLGGKDGLRTVLAASLGLALTLH